MLLFVFLNYSFILFIISVTAKTFDPITEIVIPIGLLTKEVKAETEIHQVTVKSKIRKSSI